MSKKISYPAVQSPTSKQDITKAYIQEYYAFEVAAGNITKAKLEEWIAFVDKTEAEYSTIKAFNEYRNKFVDDFFPELNKKKKEEKASAYYSSLLSKVKN